MSGGYFSYKQFELQRIADEIEQLVLEDARHDWDDKLHEQTIDEFKEAIRLLRRAYIYVQRIDWLASGDDTQHEFAQRLHQQLKDQDV
jgi:hypothetical protein